ncbi:2-oxo-4-hydroxy-4-carboxy-5-ureidoimidazoline decarboxylase [Klebsiella pneumoniae]|uniref:2-oxo-4-hydroxy-4-carboxy-5-ureidoimidazoline decarboxylase n=1 Tax=Klebsiella pneumoniae complex TaxID=3390273 RepID=UPI000666F9DB|nr:2-oxo-4-hydroxy-4-carboxy-5-ureidoimidazoline decarboxylase [Klebsiella pneumoniae]EIX9087507.1 2-oxo-4-hydroxy-4-carboxy-5-ureidoimidazoline decarboxylase [Klebsiella pneumoniae]EIX9094905.1 2-oxo-4-hydroxy-4-carboxy-5-ureidoimidazoline decarboxylase [Klebsiella pneumoniae]EIX9136245.1 2-oxo-4-hydroxy-4-carboxy-5-ureidoimidazoline decarboxylase [Klebsiella pneumoniae]EIX9653475.1 2-oxo-4-hydroxy-4-carboxy-5-ureidoimidazoline decarboxylase [Klebsiella pneumoniae]EIX9672078.1 2-oxo-4-hydroxy
MIALSQFNSLSKDEAAGLLAPCVAIPAWGEMLVSLRPFASRHALLQAARKAMANWGEDELNAALSAHPRIGEKPTGGQAHAALSRQEQSAVDCENERLAQALREGNARYEARFGRVFLIRAKGRSGDEMLQALTRRLQHTADEEVAEALAQLREITMLRLEGVIGE